MTRSGRAWRAGSATLLIATLALAGAKPRTSVVVPEWELQVVDRTGRPVARACVAEAWQQYSFEREEHIDETRTDDLGKVRFPERTVRASAFRRLVGPLSQLPLVHASYGAHAFVVVWAPELHGGVTYDGGDTLSSRVVLERDPNGFHERADGRCSPPDISASYVAPVP
jgi:hypothetical protein